MHASMLPCGQRCLLLPARKKLNDDRTQAIRRHLRSKKPETIRLIPRESASALAGSTASHSISSTGPATAHASVDLTAVAADALTNGNGLAKAILADPNIEGNQLAFLKATEAYWKEMRNRKDEPRKKGPAVITSTTDSYAALLHSNSSSRSTCHPNFGTAPAANAPTTAATAGSSNSSSMQHDFDVIMCGGTLGIAVALALQQQGYRTAVVERRLVQGRTQEWNASRHECQVLIDLGLISASDLEKAIVSEFNPIRVGFKGGDPLWVNDCLNIGIHPKTLIHSLRVRFEALGGVIYEHTEFKTAVTCPDGVVVSLAPAASAPISVGDTNRPNALGRQQQQQGEGHVRWQQDLQHVPRLLGGSLTGKDPRHDSNGSNGSTSRGGHHDSQGYSSNGHSSNSSSSSGAAPVADAVVSAADEHCAPSKLSCRLLLDCMGHYSPIVKQLRGRSKPDGMVLVVGGCATGFPAELNRTADLLTTITDASADMQLFWEAFPAEGGAARTTYMFAYSDAQPSRPSFEKLLDTYFVLLPAYQGLPAGLKGIKFKRVLFGGFPCYKDAPLKPGFDRVLQLGDASASQSPLSFGGFGSMLRHLSRLSCALAHALREDKLSQAELAWIHPYQPSLSAAMLFQRSMSIGVGQLQQQQQPLQQQQQQQQPPAKVDVPSSESAAADMQVISSSNTGNNISSNNIVALAGPSVRSRVVNASDHTSQGSTSHFKAVAVTAPAHSHYSSNISHNTVGHHGGNEVNANGLNNSSTHGSIDSRSDAQGTGMINDIHNPSSSSSNCSGSSSNSKGAPPSWVKKFLLLPADHVNALLGANFSVMLLLGQRVLKPFLQDTLQLGPLALTMLGMMLVKPLVVSRVLVQVGAKVLLSWFAHFVMLAVYSVGHVLLSPLRHVSSNFTLQRLLDALQYGSGNDYRYVKSAAVVQQEAAQLNERWTAATAAAWPATAPAPMQPAAGADRVRVQQQQQRSLQQSVERWQSSEMVSHHGQQLRYVVAGGNATQSQEEEAAGFAPPAAALVATEPAA